ncbi:bifunctional N-acetylglucosamine-1-phosphate uridyltransferase/glucosamine-1-phosphate acetyltransferase [Candidatus Tenderia electrophaga]|mgnify:CR=1 FL=1|jgi:bifunctional UDP-N-acetylglucosamine pyrophosphorylase/glucosamine-1-phosphate N-acetyltransferase|uniref:Bifunctional protein GlmU n=1 Tax=Candidatus Tenderia electrophaga TaxID=1748243 RepID=A0A0S2TGJ2_9GAMM|nr:bifunctional N-acetylglucosamine-1-phosphate uridyltransferase/glucosamine-1-phosphate acetyltransferase [Candidatus Tenderia electrophaga]
MGLSVIILAAGQGTRMRSALPKVLHKLAHKPLVEHVIDRAKQLGAEDIHVVYGHGGDAVPTTLAHCEVDWVKQAQQLGTGHAVAQAIPHIPAERDVLVLYGDVPLTSAETLKNLIQLARQSGFGLLTISLDDAAGYGRILRGDDGRVLRIIEHKDASEAERAITEVNTGILATSRKNLARWLERLDNDNAQGEYYLTDIVAMAVADAIDISTTSPSDEFEVLGVNNKRQLAALERAYQQQQAERLLDGGVTLRDPARIDIRGNVRCGTDVIMDVNLVLEGEIDIGDKVEIGPNCLISNSRIESGARILANCVIENAVVGKDSQVGPFSRLRPETVLAEATHIGNFVEIKKAQIGQGSKVNHLSYVGDAVIGRNVNIGAGTITCNYDGANKHLTEIGDEVFVGSDTQLVAPVKVGAGATIGAGSTITKAVAAGALALSRAKQISKSGWQRPMKKKS